MPRGLFLATYFHVIFCEDRYNAPMNQRQFTPIDRWLVGVNSALSTIGTRTSRQTRPNPAGDLAETTLSERERAHAAALMRVNHAGEVAAQGLYQGHGAVSRDAEIAEQMRGAADEELDHLEWCGQRLRELGSRPSVLSPIWYSGAFLIGAASGLLGDRWSLGFVEETEKQVSEHLTGHLSMLPQGDKRSRAIVTTMREEEETHGANANAAGAARLPRPIRHLMRISAKIMTGTAYWM